MMRWYVVKKPIGYKALCAARPPVSEGPVVANYETYSEALLAIKELAAFDANDLARGNA